MAQKTSLLPYELRVPLAPAAPVILSLPHSGRAYARRFLAQSVLPRRLLRSSEDAYVDALWEGPVAEGLPWIAAHFPRAYLDVNRAAGDLDPALIAGLSGPARPSARVASGLGVIPRVVAGGRAIYQGKLNKAEAEARLAQGWHPYHAALEGLINTVFPRFGQALVLDLHSMPSAALKDLGAAPDIVLGDLHGRAASPRLMATLEAALRGAGFAVARNIPFAGAYIAETYGRPATGRHVVQIEINRALYMDEALLRRRPRAFAAVKAQLATALAAFLAEAFGAAPQSLAAE
jgi:N-formylglutamate amidohydrolase